MQRAILMYRPVCTKWTSSSSTPIGNYGPPFMTSDAYPPQFSCGIESNIFGRKVAVFLRMPLPRNFGINVRQTVITTYCLSSTVGTSGASISVIYHSFPCVTFTAGPPYLLARAWGNVIWGQRTILFGLPLAGETSETRSPPTNPCWIKV